jgi:hypothetical protein
MRRLAALILLLSACGSPAGRSSFPGGASDAALEAFQRGDFDRAEALLRDAPDLESGIVRSRILLLKNRNREAADLLAALQRRYEKPTKVEEFEILTRVEADLAQAYVRLDDFYNAARVYHRLGEAVLAKKYEALMKTVGYLPDPRWEESRVELVTTDPLPLVPVEVNGATGLFIVDTGADEVLVEREFARKAGLGTIGLRTNEFQRNFDESFAETVAVGSLRVRNVPVHLGAMPPVAGVKAEGVIGLSFLMHYDFTIDFRRQRLILRKAGSSAAAGGAPALWAGDRNLLVEGSMNGAKVFVGLNSGLAGVTVAASPAFLQQRAEEVRDLAVGALRFVKPPLDTRNFPMGLDSSYGFPVGFVLGQRALRKHSVRVDPRSMRAWID